MSTEVLIRVKRKNVANQNYNGVFRKEVSHPVAGPQTFGDGNELFCALCQSAIKTVIVEFVSIGLSLCHI